MALKLVKTKNAAFVVDEVQDNVREKMGILFGRAIHLYAKRVPTAANPKGVMQYSDYFSNQAVQVCRKDNIVEDRPEDQE
ncbi:hypothetical protein LOB20_08505 [Lactobacillus delbrueckii subsp. lactis]|nr:hypothetical protein [Lactobacillus delbrueckii]MCD5568023.1 hypothetical protein [Lactobacillus delbrueckii subsp. lactis]